MKFTYDMYVSEDFTKFSKIMDDLICDLNCLNEVKKCLKNHDIDFEGLGNYPDTKLMISGSSIEALQNYFCYNKPIYADENFADIIQYIKGEFDILYNLVRKSTNIFSYNYFYNIPEIEVSNILIVADMVYDYDFGIFYEMIRKSYDTLIDVYSKNNEYKKVIAEKFYTFYDRLCQILKNIIKNTTVNIGDEKDEN